MIAETTPTFRGFYFDEAKGLVVHLSGRIVFLRSQSTEVFRILANKPNVVVSRRHFEDTIWKNSVVTVDSLTQCIYEIRKILGDSKRKTLVTIPKTGYLFREDVVDNSNVESIFAHATVRGKQHNTNKRHTIPRDEDSPGRKRTAQLISLR